MIERFGLPTRIFPEIVPPGTLLGALRESVAERAGLGRINVVAPPTHDTGAAVAGVPTANTGTPNWAYISSGTWSLMGVEAQSAQLSARTLELNLTNEGGIDGTYRLLKNIMGLWLVQQCKRAFEARGGNYDYTELARLAGEAAPLRSLVDPDDSRFLNPPDMAEAIQSFCRETGQPVPETEGELVRCAYESLALKYREVLGWLEELAGSPIEVIHIVGGGSQSTILNQFAADACGKPVVTGPVEATAMGNLLVQVRASGEVGSLAQMRDVVRASSSVGRFEPADGSKWQDAYVKFQALRHRK
jgi:rhamnulokinase